MHLSARLLSLIAVALIAATALARAGDGATRLTYEGEPVTLLRDGYGVPHVFAKSDPGAYFGNGYAIAQDRLAQMEKYRRSAWGELAELAGPGALGSDISNRREGYTEAEREAQFRRAAPAMRVALRAYAAGVNRYLKEIEAHGYPPAVKALGIRIRPWKVTDSIAVGQMMARRFGGSGAGELRNAQVEGVLSLLYGKHAAEMVDDLIWANDPDAPTTIPRRESPRRPGRRTAGAPRRLPPEQRALLPHSWEEWRAMDAVRATVEHEDVLRYAAAHGLPTQFGSYAMAISGSRTLSGQPILLGGPQMGFRTPQIAHEIHLVAPGLNVIGMGFSGVPGVLIGHNQRLAWTTTTGVGDVADTYVETLDPANPDEYRYQDKWRPLEKRVETFRIRGKQPVTRTLYRSVHGPIMKRDVKKHRAYAVRYAYWNAELDTLEAIASFNRAANIREFAAAIPKIATSHNWLCATQAGDIGYWFAGRFPRRPPGVDWRFPVPGDGKHEWQGFLTPEELPHVINPKQGFLANWNNKPAVWWSSSDTPAWGPIHRVQRIFDLLGRDRRLTPPKLVGILQDIGLNQPEASHFLPLLDKALRREPLSATEETARRYLQDWDGHAPEGSVGKTIYDAYFDELRDRLFDEFRLVADKGLRNQALRPGVVYRALQGRKASVPMRFNYLGKHTAAEIQRQAFHAAVKRLTAARGPQVNAWGHQHGEIHFAPLPGIPKTSRGTYIQIVELSKPRVLGVNILPPGESEEPGSPHFGDQRELAGYWRFKPMLTDRKAIEAAGKG